MDLEKITVSEMFDMTKTEEGQQIVFEAFKKEIESNENLKRLANWLGSYVLNEGVEDTENRLDSISKFVETITSMPEEKATEYITEIVDSLFTDENISDEQKEEMVSQFYRKPDKLYQSLAKVTDKVFDGKTFNGKAVKKNVNVTNKNSKKKVLVPVKIYNPTVHNKGEEYLNILKPYDREVFNGCCTILSTGQTLMTPHQIYETINGKPTTSPQAIQSIDDSMCKMQITPVEMDWTEHAILNGIDLDREKEHLKVREPIIPFSRVEFESYGKKVIGYKILSTPALYYYSEKIKQISTTERKILQIPNISNTPENMVIRSFLIRRVEHLKNNKNWNDQISFQYIFEECEISGDKKKMSNKRKVVFSILDYWKDINYITDYEIIKKGRVYTGIKIVV